MKTICLTGGPCGGKTTAMARIVARFGERGWDVRVVPEAATLLIGGGLKPWALPSDCYVAFQRELVGLQIQLEKAYAVGAGDNTLLVCDRGIPDASAYIDPLLWPTVLAAHGLTEITARDGRYDAVLHLVTAAIGAEAYYTLENNPARTETREQAVAADHACRKAWVGHPHYRLIENTATFEDKMQRLLREVANVVGDPTPVESERKFLVRPTTPPPWPGEAYEVVQHYLSVDPAHEIRIRRRGRNGHWLFTRTVKRPTPDGSGRFEVEDVLTAEEYFALLKAWPDMPLVRKFRQVFLHGGYYMELDHLPGSNRFILEIETTDKGEIPLPPFLELVREVTDDPHYSNRSMARMST